MNDNHPEIAELLAIRATAGLSRTQQEELERLRAKHGIEDTQDFDLAAAAAANAFMLDDAAAAREVPATLQAKLRQDADQFFSRPADNVVRFHQPDSKRSWNWGWATAAALAAILLASNIPEFNASSNYAADREQLIADAAETVVLPWAAPEQPGYERVRGDVVWNDERQEGFMLLAGMPVNDPAKSQYQLWLVNSDRYAYPVDGGVFDIPDDGSPVIIPIDAKLEVDNPTAFAITREQPGGVVVSQGPLLVVSSTT